MGRIHPRPPTYPSRRSFAAPALLCLAAAAVPRLAAAAPDRCQALLADLGAVARTHEYVVTTSAGVLSGTRPDATQLQARCTHNRAEVLLFDRTGAKVRIDWSAHGLHIHGQFPALGHLTQSWLPDDGHVDMRVEAEGAGASAYAVFDGDSGAWAASGDAPGVNEQFRARLRSSPAWRDAHALLFGTTGVARSGLEGDRDALRAVLDPAIPLPGADRDVDKGSLKKDCGATVGICAVAYFWKPATGACVAAGIKCLSAFKCWKSDCSGDGKQ